MAIGGLPTIRLAMAILDCNAAWRTIEAHQPARLTELFVADAWWIAPDGEPLGPMSLEVSCTMDGPACRLRVRQSGPGDGPRWRRYFDVIARGWISSLAALKKYLER